MDEIKKWSIFWPLKKLSSGKLKLCLRHGLCRDSISLPTVFAELKLKIENYLLTKATKKGNYFQCKFVWKRVKKADKYHIIKKWIK